MERYRVHTIADQEVDKVLRIRQLVIDDDVPAELVNECLRSVQDISPDFDSYDILLSLSLVLDKGTTHAILLN